MTEHYLPPGLKKRVIAFDFLDYLIDRDDDDKAEYGLVQGSRGGHSQVGASQKGTEHVHVDHVGGVKELAVVPHDLIEHLEVPPEYTADLQEEHDNNRGPD